MNKIYNKSDMVFAIINLIFFNIIRKFKMYLHTQQTPKLLAHAPATIPPFCRQSGGLRQVPLSPALVAHMSLGN